MVFYLIVSTEEKPWPGQDSASLTCQKQSQEPCHPGWTPNSLGLGWVLVMLWLRELSCPIQRIGKELIEGTVCVAPCVYFLI